MGHGKKNAEYCNVARLDHLLLTTNITIAFLATRFEVSKSYVQERSKLLGLKTIRENGEARRVLSNETGSNR